jgi:Uma2 family endonuclease
MSTYIIDFRSVIQFSDEQFYQLCRHNPHLNLQLTGDGKLILKSDTDDENGHLNREICANLGVWNDQHKLGVCFDSSTCFKLPNNSKYSPNISWISQFRWEHLTSEQKEKFPAIAPDFVLELISSDDMLKNHHNKMREYITNGVKLGWLIDPETKKIEIYRIGQEVEILHHPSSLSGEEVLPDLILDLTHIW